jgi:uncharacterized protein YkwD
MKISPLFKSALLLVVLCFMAFSCKKDDESFHQISAIETQIHNRINDYREQQGLNRLVLQPIMFEEARVHSDRMANGSIGVGGDGIDQIFADIKDKIGGTTQGWVVLKTFNTNADSIVKVMTSDSATAAIITKQYTQSGVGVSYDDEGAAYITHLFLEIPDKK